MPAEIKTVEIDAAAGEFIHYDVLRVDTFVEGDGFGQQLLIVWTTLGRGHAYRGVRRVRVYPTTDLTR